MNATEEAVKSYRAAARRHKEAAKDHKQHNRPLHAAIERRAAYVTLRAIEVELLDPTPETP